MTLDRLAAGPPLDVAIIGGGINGSGIALEAARAGLHVALFEMQDFGFGTTWRSTKLIHGGLRYLEHGDVRLVFESLRERSWLLKSRPHLVHPQRLLLPMLPWTRRPAWQLRAGLTTYDAMAAGGGVPRHRWLDRDALQRRVPFLPDAADGAFAFYDARAVAPERLALEMALEAEAAGAVIFNHAKVTGIRTAEGAVEAIDVQHEGRNALLATRCVVNAAGPWVDAVNEATGVGAPELLGVTRGAHIVLETDYPTRDGIFSTARSDGRVFFAVPQDGLLLIGTTDTRFEGDPGSVRPTAEEVDYLLDEARGLLPGLAPSKNDVRYSYAGLRPLQRAEGGPEAAITRRHELVNHAESDGPQGLYSVIGGKLSTYRPVGRELLKELGAKPARQEMPANPGQWRELLGKAPFDTPVLQRLRIYGPALEGILSGPPDLVSAVPVVLQTEVEHAVRSERATTLSDFMLRRSRLGWNRERGLDCHEAVANSMAALLGWNDSEVRAQVTAYEADVRANLPNPAELEGTA